MFLTLLAIFLIAASGGELSEKESRQLDDLVEENRVFEFDEMNADGISAVVDASLIEVKVINLFDRNCTSKTDCGYTTHTILKSDETLMEVIEYNDLLPFIRPSFKLKTETDANDFEQMLDVFFPVFFSGGKDIYQDGDTWVFVREESFGELNGILVTVDGDGVVLKIEEVEGLESGDVER